MNQLKSVYLCFVSLLLLSSACLNAGHYSKNDVKVFMDMTMQHRFTANLERLSKWGRLIGIEIVGQASDEDRQLIQKTMNDVNQAVGRDVMTMGEIEPNLIMYFMGNKEFSKLMKIQNFNRKSLSRAISNQDREITAGYIFITNSLSGNKRKAAIRNTMTAVLGFNGYSRVMKHTAMGGATNTFFPEYKSIEKKMIEMLFRKDVKPGMNRDQLKQTLLSLGPISEEERAEKEAARKARAADRSRAADYNRSLAYYLLLNGKQEGPYNAKQIRAMLSAGRITSDTPAWKKGTPSQWKRVTEVLQQ